MQPAYITATRSAIRSAAARSCVIISSPWAAAPLRASTCRLQFVHRTVHQLPVETGGRLVGEQQRRVTDQGQGGRGALGEAAGELVGMEVEVVLGKSGPLGRRQDRVLEPRSAPYPLQLGYYLAQLRANGAYGREVGGRALGHEADPAAPDGAYQGAFVGGEEVQIAQKRLARGLRVAGEQAEEGRGEDGLAAAALAEQGEALAGQDVEARVGDRGDGAAVRHEETHRQAAYGQDGGRHCHSMSSDRRRGLIRSRQAPASPATARVGTMMRRPGKSVGHHW